MGILNRFMNFIGIQEEEEVIEREQIIVQDDGTEVRPYETRKHKGNVVSLHTQKKSLVILNEPSSLDDAQEIADDLRLRKAVVVNLHLAPADQALRIVDFLSGTVYALGGAIAKIGPNIFLCTPDTVEIHGSISDMLHDGKNGAEYNLPR